VIDECLIPFPNGASDHAWSGPLCLKCQRQVQVCLQVRVTQCGKPLAQTQLYQLKLADMTKGISLGRAITD